MVAEVTVETWVRRVKSWRVGRTRRPERASAAARRLANTRETKLGLPIQVPANYYPEFKKYPHFHGNYGSSWWRQKDEFETFKDVKDPGKAGK